VVSSFSPFFLSLRGLFIERKQILEALEFLEKLEVVTPRLLQKDVSENFNFHVTLITTSSKL